MRDSLIELIDEFIRGADVVHWYSDELDEKLADYLLANGIVVIDTNTVSQRNRPLISQCFGKSLDEIIELVNAKEIGRVIVPPCKVGDIVYAVSLNTETNTTAIHRGYVGSIDIRNTGNYLFICHEGFDDEPYFKNICGKFEDFGKFIFFTKEEAEEALAKIGG